MITTFILLRAVANIKVVSNLDCIESKGLIKNNNEQLLQRQCTKCYLFVYSRFRSLCAVVVPTLDCSWQKRIGLDKREATQ